MCASACLEGARPTDTSFAWPDVVLLWILQFGYALGIMSSKERRGEYDGVHMQLLTIDTKDRKH